MVDWKERYLREVESLQKENENLAFKFRQHHLSSGSLLQKYCAENAAQAQRIAELEGIFKMLALRAKSFPSFPIGGHIPEVFVAIGESVPDYLLTLKNGE